MNKTVLCFFVLAICGTPARLFANYRYFTIDESFDNADVVVVATITDIVEAGEMPPFGVKLSVNLMVESVLKGDATAGTNFKAYSLIVRAGDAGARYRLGRPELHVGQRARFFIRTSSEVYLPGERKKTRVYESWLGFASSGPEPDSLPGEAVALPLFASAPGQPPPGPLPEPRSLDQRFASREMVVIGSVVKCARVRPDTSGRDLWAAELNLKMIPKGSALGKTLTVFFHAAPAPAPGGGPAAAQFPAGREVRLFLTRRAIGPDAPAPYLELASDVTEPDALPRLQPGQVLPP